MRCFVKKQKSKSNPYKLQPQGNSHEQPCGFFSIKEVTIAKKLIIITLSACLYTAVFIYDGEAIHDITDTQRNLLKSVSAP